MHVDWRWIKQRPHYLAEELGVHDFDVLVMYVPSLRHGRLSSNPTKLHRRPLLLVPMRRWAIVRLVNRLLGPVQVWLAVQTFKPDVLLLTSPDLVDALPPRLATRIHYDCLDLATGFAGGRRHAKWIQNSEMRLIRRAASITTSSILLREHVISLGAPPSRVTIVRNGLGAVQPLPPYRHSTDGYIEIGYVGTISDWLDLDVLLEVSRGYPRVRWHLWGPKTISLPSDPCFVYHGVVPRHRLADQLAFLAAFVMPFRLSPLVRAVDPVKLYEYLAWSRPVISVWYGELEQFSSLVQFYRDADTLGKCVERIASGAETGPSREQVQDLLKDATWVRRAEQMSHAIREGWPDGQGHGRTGKDLGHNGRLEYAGGSGRHRSRADTPKRRSATDPNGQ